MNPRVSRSSALASKATGFPIAKIAAKLAVGYTLDEIPNDITKKTPASFEPTIDYVVVKIPKWAFEKFPESDPTLGTQMKSVGEVMAIGRTFKEAFFKGVRSLETGKDPGTEKIDKDLIRHKLDHADSGSHSLPAACDRQWLQHSELVELTHIDPWFLNEMKEITDVMKQLSQHTIETLPPDLLREAKESGFSDARIAQAARRKAARCCGKARRL